LNRFLEDNYEEIMLMSKKICKSNSEWEDVAHFCIIKFTEHERAQELIQAGEAMRFMSGMIHRSFWSNTSQYYTEYHQKGRMEPCHTIYDDALGQVEEFDMEKEIAIEAILGQIEDMKHTDGEGGNRDIKLYEMAELLQQWSETPNFSELSRKTKIPRTAIAHSVKSAIEYIQYQLKQNNIRYDN
jgi:hypothetical protein